MVLPSSIRLPSDFWERARAARHRLLLLDYDGTLAPLQMDRSTARPLPGIVPLLEAIAGGADDEVAVLSGRPLSQLLDFLGEIPIHLVGENGWEIRFRGGRTVHHPLPDGCAAALRGAAAAAEAAGMGNFLERKRTALVLHTRGLPPSHAQELERAWRLLWKARGEEPALKLSPVDGGLEARAAGRDKGTAARELLDFSDPDTLAVHLGDDWTDEDAFREVARHGFGIRVGPGERDSLATGRIFSCEATLDFLHAWRGMRRDDDSQGTSDG